METSETCVYGVRGCIHAGREHDEDCCFNGMWPHAYVCQDCGHEMPATASRLKLRPDGTFVPPEFKPLDCRACGGKKSMT
jgi:hypothetical protein